LPYIEPSRRVARFDYDFAVDGGGVGTIALRGTKVPGSAIMTDAILRVDTALTGGTVTDTVALQAESAGDLQAAAARNAAPWSTTGAKRITLNAGVNPVLLTQDRAASLVIAATGLTAGKFRLFVMFLDPTT
jgi:hypothetical protein